MFWVLSIVKTFHRIRYGVKTFRKVWSSLPSIRTGLTRAQTIWQGVPSKFIHICWLLLAGMSLRSTFSDNSIPMAVPLGELLLRLCLILRWISQVWARSSIHKGPYIRKRTSPSTGKKKRRKHEHWFGRRQRADLFRKHSRWKANQPAEQPGDRFGEPHQADYSEAEFGMHGQIGMPGTSGHTKRENGQMLKFLVFHGLIRKP